MTAAERGIARDRSPGAGTGDAEARSAVTRSAPASARRPVALTRPIRLAAALALLFALVVGCAPTGGGTIPERLPAVGPPPTPTPLPPIRLPEDEAPHDAYTEWWYYTGHLSGADDSGRQREYGFELTFFRTLRGRLPPYYAAHFAVTDVTTGRFTYDERSGFASTGRPPVDGSASPSQEGSPGFDLALDGWSVRGLAGRDRLVAAMEGYSIDLATTDRLPGPVLHGGNGIIGYGDAGFSYYYSRPLLDVAGTIVDHGTRLTVSGQAWMDHQWGDFVTLAGTGWDWLSVQLDDGSAYMVYVIRDRAKRPLSTVGTAVRPDGATAEIPEADLRVEALGTWTSPRTGGVYPSGWKVSAPSLGLSLALSPLVLDQELVTTRSTGVAYWEGAVSVRGEVRGRAVAGKGYVELTGYATLPGAPVSLPR